MSLFFRGEGKLKPMFASIGRKRETIRGRTMLYAVNRVRNVRTTCRRTVVTIGLLGLCVRLRSTVRSFAGRYVR